MEELVIPQVRIERPLYEQEQLRKVYQYENEKKSAFKDAILGCTKCKPSKLIKKTIPVIDWLSHYQWRRDFTSDLISGITVAIMHIPQGMAYALLSNLPPIVGIYTAFFPVLIYTLFGTSRHNSMGTFAVVCLLTGTVVLEHGTVDHIGRSLGWNPQFNKTEHIEVSSTPIGPIYSPMEVGTLVCLIVAIYQVIMYVFQLGILSALLSETLVSGFTTGASFCVLISQIKDLLGLSIPNHRGYFVNINIVMSIIEQIPNTNYMAAIISLVTIFVMSVNNEIIKPHWSKKFAVPIPIELIMVLTGTLVSKYCFLHEDYGIKTVGSIPSGLPTPSLPVVGLAPSILLECFTIAIVSYTITLSMALIFAQKLQYEVDANQELLAMGAGNAFGSFFSCIPFCASLSRSLIQQTVGGKTQMTSFISCGILLFVLLWIGPFFEPLPKCVLASIIVVALKGMLVQVTAVYKFYKLSKLDAMVWIITFITVVFVSIDIGLFVGIGLSLLTILLLGFQPYTCLLGNIPKTDLYLDIKKFKTATEVPHLKIFHYQGGINFATKNYFKTELFRLTGIEPHAELALRKKLAKYESSEYTLEKQTTVLNVRLDELQKKVHTDVKCLILDFSALSYIDPSGASFLKVLSEEFKKIDIPTYIAGCSAPVYDMMEKCDLVHDKNRVFRFFPTLHDAVECAVSIFGDYDSSTIISTISRL